MKLAELSGQLNRLLEADPESGEFEVLTEGCDCSGDVGSVEVLYGVSQVRLNRAYPIDYNKEYEVEARDPLDHILPENRKYLP